MHRVFPRRIFYSWQHNWLVCGLTVLLFSASVPGCFDSESLSDAEVARVESKVLSVLDVDKALEERGEDPADLQLRAVYINYWIDRELLLSEAKKRKIDSRREIEEYINNLREEIYINQLYKDVIEEHVPEEKDLVEYWQSHQGEFTRAGNEVKLIIIEAPTRSNGWSVRNGLDKSRTGEDLMGTYPNLVIDTTGWVPRDWLPDAIKKNLKNLRPNDPSLPFPMNDRWFVVKLVAKATAGEIRSLEEVRDEISKRLAAEFHSRAEISYLSNLRREARRNGRVKLNTLLQEPVQTTVTGVEDTTVTNQGSGSASNQKK